MFCIATDAVGMIDTRHYSSLAVTFMNQAIARAAASGSQVHGGPWRSMEVHGGFATREEPQAVHQNRCSEAESHARRARIAKLMQGSTSLVPQTRFIAHCSIAPLDLVDTNACLLLLSFSKRNT